MRKDILFDQGHHRTTVSSIEGRLSTRWSPSESRASASPRLLVSKGSPGTPSLAGSRKPLPPVVASAIEGSPDSAWRSSRRTRFAPCQAAKRIRRGSSSRWRSGLVSGPRPSSDVEATGITSRALTPAPPSSSGWIAKGTRSHFPLRLASTNICSSHPMGAVSPAAFATRRTTSGSGMTRLTSIRGPTNIRPGRRMGFESRTPPASHSMCSRKRPMARVAPNDSPRVRTFNIRRPSRPTSLAGYRHRQGPREYHQRGK